MTANAMESYKALMAHESGDTPSDDECAGMFVEHYRLGKKRRTANENKLLDRYYVALKALDVIR